MCGRVNVIDSQAVQDLCGDLGITMAPVAPRYNIAPGQFLITLVNQEDTVSHVDMEWGLVMPWVKAGARPLTNARAETIWDKPSYRKLVASRRGVVIVTGFYEWRRQSPSVKTPFHIHHPDGAAFALGAIWHVSRDGVLQVCIITTAPNGIMQPIHNRMPVVIAPASIESWLKSDDRPFLDAQMQPCPDAWLIADPVSTYVNNARNDGPECVRPAPAQGALL